MNLYLMRMRVEGFRTLQPFALVRAPDAPMAGRLLRLLSGNKCWESARVEELARDVEGPQQVLVSGTDNGSVR